jgi:hypothetical protein
MGRISATTRSGRRLARMPTDYFKRLLEEAWANHAYLISHKFKDCGMMRSFMTLGSLTCCAKPDGSNAAAFLEEKALMMVFEGCPLVGRHYVSSLRPRIPTHGGWGCTG